MNECQSCKHYLYDKNSHGYILLYCKKRETCITQYILENPCDDYEPSIQPPADHPAHYNTGDIECIDAIESALTPEEFEGFCKGNIIKYVWRENHKGGREDLEKAVWYLKRLIEKGRDDNG